MIGLIPASLNAVAVIVAVGIEGWLLLLIFGKRDFLDFASAGFPLGAGATTWVIFLVSWAGIRLDMLNICLTVLALTLLLGLIAWRFAPRSHANSRSERTYGFIDNLNGENIFVIALWSLLAILMLSAATIAIGRSYSRWDAAAGWAIKGYGIMKEGTILAGEEWGAWGLAYPLNIPILIGLFWMMDGDVLPGSKLVFPLFMLSALFGFYRYFRRQGVSPKTILLFVIFLASNALIFLHGTIGYANLPLATYLLLAATFAIEGAFNEEKWTLLLAGLLLGMASWTRAEAVLHCMAIIIPIALILWMQKRSLRMILPLVAPWAMTVMIWFVFDWRSVEHSHLGHAMGGFLSKFLSGQINLRYLYLIPRTMLDRALDLNEWGLFFPVVAIMILLGLKRLDPRQDRRGFVTMLIAILLSLVPVALFYVRSFTRWSDFIPLLNRSFDRAFLPAAFSIALLAFQVHVDALRAQPEEFGQVGGRRH